MRLVYRPRWLQFGTRCGGALLSCRHGIVWRVSDCVCASAGPRPQHLPRAPALQVQPAFVRKHRLCGAPNHKPLDVVTAASKQHSERIDCARLMHTELIERGRHWYIYKQSRGVSSRETLHSQEVYFRRRSRYGINVCCALRFAYPDTCDFGFVKKYF